MTEKYICSWRHEWNTSISLFTIITKILQFDSIVTVFNSIIFGVGLTDLNSIFLFIDLIRG